MSKRAFPPGAAPGYLYRERKKACIRGVCWCSAATACVLVFPSSGCKLLHSSFWRQNCLILTVRKAHTARLLAWDCSDTTPCLPRWEWFLKPLRALLLLFPAVEIYEHLLLTSLAIVKCLKYIAMCLTHLSVGVISVWRTSNVVHILLHHIWFLFEGLLQLSWVWISCEQRKGLHKILLGQGVRKVKPLS